MNSYFATAAQQANPKLRGKPVGIVKAVGRGCVIAASIEAKKFGAKTGMTVADIQKLCPQIALVPADMDLYFSLTQRLMHLCRDYSAIYEVFSIDEFFLDVTDSQQCFSGGAVHIAWELKSRIAEELGEWMKCSAGIGFTRVLAKLASEMRKPDGLTVLTRDNYVTATADLPVSEVCGIGYGRTRYLYARGAYTLRQARALPDLPPEIAQLVWLEADEPLQETEDLNPAKSVSRTFTTFRVYDTDSQIQALVRNLTEEAAAKLREMNLVGRTVGLRLAAENLFWDRQTFKIPTADPLVIFDALWKNYQQRPIDRVRQAGVFISNLSCAGQQSLFERREALLGAADQVNQKWGLFTLYPARLLGGELVRPEVTGYLGDKYYRFNTVK